MTYSNGLGNLHNLLGTVATADTKRTDASISATDVATTTAARTDDHTQFSKASGLLGGALSGPDARMPKVLALAAAIASGNYQVSSSDVAGKMIDSIMQ
jgi:negative regulator of flagellin synthesis FlgM